jgi:predicted nucleic acid-binding Zn ribbon protein
MTRARDRPIDPALHTAWSAMTDAEHHEASSACENKCRDLMEFPRRSERSRIYLALEMLAVVALMRVWTTGGKKKGVAEDNSAAAIEGLRGRLVDLAFPETQDRADFEALLTALKRARDTAIAHTHATPSGLAFMDPFVVSGHSSNIMNTIDVYVFIPCVEKLHEAVRQVLDEAAQIPD